MLEYLVTGTGRCGTTYMAKFLTLSGLNCSHEAFYNCKACGGDLENSSSGQRVGLPKPNVVSGEASLFAAPFASSFKGKVIHLTRHPLLVIRSFVMDLKFFHEKLPKAEWQKKTQAFIAFHVPGIMDMPDPISRAALFYIEWNKIIENSMIRLHHRIEDDPDRVVQFLKPTAKSLHFEDIKCNSQANPDSTEVTWNDIPFIIRDDLEDCANKYGYNTK